MKKYFLMAACAMTTISAMAAWDGTAQAWSKGDGTQQSPYLIENEQHLAYFQQQVTAGTTFAGEYVRLENDLDMSADAGQKMLPIGFFDEYVNTESADGGLVDDSKYFLGTFDGNFKVIDNIHIEYVATDFEAVGGTGLFACLDEGALVKNVTLGSRSIVTGGELTAGIVGQMNGGMVQNCANLATINSSSTFGTGGVVAVAAGGSIDCCYQGGIVNGNSDVGGIVGTLMYGAQVTNCYNKGAINAPNGYYVGGIVGSAYDAGTLIANCYNTGSVVAVEGFLSNPQPIVGDAGFGVEVKNCCFLDNGKFEESDGVVLKSDEEMKSEAVITLLNADNATALWQLDSKNLNNGYPVFAWQNDPTAGVTLREVEQAAIAVRNGAICILHADAVTDVKVYDMRGALVYQGSEKVVNLSQRGVYVVVVDGKVTKVRL